MTGLARLAALAAVVAASYTSACGGTGHAPSAPVEQLSAPATITAGEPIHVVAFTTTAGPVLLDVVDPFAVTTLEAHTDGSTVRFVVDGSLTRLGGTITFLARGPSGEAVMASTAITPAPAVSPIDLTVGPRTVVADGRDETMAVAIAADRYGNPVEDGASVVLTTDDGSVSTIDAAVDRGVASTLIGSDTTAGRVAVFADLPTGAPVRAGRRGSAAPIRSPRITFDEVAGPPAAVALFVDPEPGDDAPPADSRSLIMLRTSPIADRHGNPVPDGYLVRLDIDGPEGPGTLTATTIDAVARYSLRAPGRPGPVELHVDAAGVDGAPLVLDFASAISELPIEVRAAGTGVTIEIGPVLDRDGALVPDGTVAEVAGLAHGGGNEPVIVELLAGRATVLTDPAAHGAASVTVLGATTEERW